MDAAASTNILSLSTDRTTDPPVVTCSFHIIRRAVHRPDRLNLPRVGSSAPETAGPQQAPTLCQLPHGCAGRENRDTACGISAFRHAPCFVLRDGSRACDGFGKRVLRAGRPAHAWCDALAREARDGPAQASVDANPLTASCSEPPAVSRLDADHVPGRLLATTTGRTACLAGKRGRGQTAPSHLEVLHARDTRPRAAPLPRAVGRYRNLVVQEKPMEGSSHATRRSSGSCGSYERVVK